ncbi:MAG: hypothetical protein PHF86_13850 [Candidatus Nanoarchaeia archaeon]|nr:hypothetical protein [Candidatus Nanoarchaeia archaeon]
MINDIIEVIGEIKSNLELIRIKLSKGEVNKAKELTSRSMLVLLKIQQHELAKNLNVLNQLLEQNNISGAHNHINEVQTKIERLMRIEGNWALCRKCGWKNPQGTNYCNNCRYYLK